MTFAVGDYQATELLAAGGTAQVWLGRRVATGEAVAMKVFPPDQLAAVRREAALAAAVDHPHVVTVLDVVADEHRVALVTEYAAGGDLADLLSRRGRLSPGQTLTVLIPLAAALATAHERQVVHGDISAANIVLDRAGRPLLADLGAARAAMESGRPVQATPCDAAPELARAGAPTPASDMFSLGSVALACLTGRAAWPADDLRDVLIQAAAGQWPDLADDAAPAPLVAAVRSLLEHDPDRRPGAASLVLDLRSAGRPEPLDVSDDRRAARLPRADAGPGHPSEPDRSPSPRRHGRDDDEHPVADQPGLPLWGRPDSVATDEWASGSRRSDTPTAARARVLTRVRPDSPADENAAPTAGRARRRPAWLPAPIGSAPPGRSRKMLRITVLVAASVIVAVLAGLVGLRWAASGRAVPVAAQQLAPLSAAAGGTGRSSAAATPATSTAPQPSSQHSSTRQSPVPTPSTAAPRPSPGATPVTRATPAATTAGTRLSTARADAARSADWTATIQALDRARSKALVARDPALLDAVYTTNSTARSADEKTISTLVGEGLRVSGAEHRVQSVQLVAGAAATILVRDSLPSYQVLGATGSVVGRTPGRAASTRVMVLVQTSAGYRISEVRTP